MTGLMQGKRGLVMGVANDHSIAWGIAKKLREQGADLAFTYQGEAFGRRVKPLAEQVLTPRQRQVCALVARGLTNSQVASRTGVTERTVRKHLEDVFERTGCTSRTAVALWWRDREAAGAPGAH